MKRLEGRHKVLHLNPRYLSLRMVKKSPSRDTRIWSVVIVIKQDTYISIVLNGKGRTKARKVSRNIGTVVLLVMILLFFVTMNHLILYQMRTCR